MKHLNVLVKPLLSDVKLSWKPPQGNTSLELFLCQIERELFEIPKKCSCYSNFSKRGMGMYAVIS